MGQCPVRRRYAFEANGAAVVGGMASPLLGAEGNVEFFLHLRSGAKPSRSSAGRPDPSADSLGRRRRFLDRAIRGRPIPGRPIGPRPIRLRLVRNWHGPWTNWRCQWLFRVLPTAVAAGRAEMARIGFAPHSERPKAVRIAKSVGTWLVEQGHQAFFLEPRVKIRPSPRTSPTLTYW